MDANSVKDKGITQKKLNPVPIPTVVIKQIGVDLCSLSEVDGYRRLQIPDRVHGLFLEMVRSESSSG